MLADRFDAVSIKQIVPKTIDLIPFQRVGGMGLGVGIVGVVGGIGSGVGNVGIVGGRGSGVVGGIGSGVGSTGVLGGIGSGGGTAGVACIGDTPAP